jgi:hypothetical protein
VVLWDRILFDADLERRRYHLTVPVAFDRVLSVVVPEWGSHLQETVAFPPGFEPVFWSWKDFPAYDSQRKEYRYFLAAARFSRQHEYHCLSRYLILW